jgi:hypothetical protein
LGTVVVVFECKRKTTVYMSLNDTATECLAHFFIRFLRATY